MRDLNQLNGKRRTDLETAIYGCTGDSGNGIFRIYIHGVGFHVVASNGGGWDHVSVSLSNRKAKRCPSWEEMCAIKDMFFDKEEVVVQYHPRESEYVNVHNYCLHLWRPQGKDVPVPPMYMV